MRQPVEYINTLREDGRPGESIPKVEYQAWSHFILSTLAIDDELTLNDLLERAQNKTSETGAPNDKTSWYILQVKRDLEARQLIKVVPSSVRKHTFLLKLTWQGRSKVQVSAWGHNDL
jgi:hypothetical protein